MKDPLTRPNHKKVFWDREGRRKIPRFGIEFRANLSQKELMFDYRTPKHPYEVTFDTLVYWILSSMRYFLTCKPIPASIQVILICLLSLRCGILRRIGHR